MKILLTLLCFVISVITIHAQNTLTYSQALIVSDTELTVPAGKVWKVTSIYGHEFTLNQCVSNEAIFDWLGIKCNPTYTSGTRSVRISYFATIFKVNGKEIVNEISGLPAQLSPFNSTHNCTGSTWSSNVAYGVACANRTANPNLLPMWLPEGTTLETNGPNTFLSVIEFDIEP